MAKHAAPQEQGTLAVTQEQSQPRRWRSLASALAFLCAVILGVGIFVVALVAMNARWEDEDLSAPAPSSEESLRQTLAVDAERIARLATTLNSEAATKTNTQLAAATQQVQQDAAAWTAMLGGVWVPWPNGAPEGYENPELSLEPSEVSAAALSSALNAFAAALPNLASSREERQLLTSISAKSYFWSDRITTITGETQLSEHPTLTDIGAKVPDAQTVVQLDLAKQLLETRAALTPAQQQPTLRRTINALDVFNNDALAAGAKDERAIIAPTSTIDPYAVALNALVRGVGALPDADPTTPQISRQLAYFMAKYLISPAQLKVAAPGYEANSAQ